MQKQKKNRKTWVLWIIILLLLGVLVYTNAYSKEIKTTGPKLGAPGTEYFNQEPKKKEVKTQGQIGASIPASIVVQEGKALITIKNTGDLAFVPYTLIEGREIYRASRVIQPKEKVSVVIKTGNAKKCITYVETLSGEKFSITSKLVR